MPPKKKGKKGGKDGKKKGGKDGDLTEADKLKMKSHEVESLKDNLALRKDFSRRSKAAFEDLKEKLEETHQQIDEISSTHKASNAYLTHQYKTLQNEMAIKTHNLEAELQITRKRLEQTEDLLKRSEEEKREIIRQKDEQIADLNEKNRKCETTYDNIIQLSLDSFIQRLEIVKQDKWEPAIYGLQERNKVLLHELGLKIHDI